MSNMENGLLPSDEWLLSNGYSDLVKAMHENPELFKHIHQEGKVADEKEGGPTPPNLERG